MKQKKIWAFPVLLSVVPGAAVGRRKTATTGRENAVIFV